MINRYDNPQIFKYESQFVPTELPWDMIQSSMDREQKKRDDFKTGITKLAANPTGLQYTTDHYGNTVKLPDYEISAAKAQEINTKLEGLSKKVAGSELNSDIYGEYTELAKEKTALDNMNKTLDARTKWVEEQTKYRRDQKINPGDARDIQFQKELYKMMSPEGINYVPTVHGVQDIIDTGEWVKKTVGDIKVEAASSMSKNAGYFNSYENRKITRDKILNSLTGGFEADQQMQEYVKNMADQNADLLYSRGRIESNDPNALMKTPDGKEISVYEATRQDHFNNLMQNAEKYIYSDTTQKMSADSSYWEELKQTATLPIITANSYKEDSDFFGFDKIKDRIHYKNSDKNLATIAEKMLPLKEGNPDDAQELKQLRAAYDTELHFKTSYENNYNLAEKRVVEKGKDSIKKQTQDLIDEYSRNVVHRIKELPAGHTQKDIDNIYLQSKEELPKLKQLLSKIDRINSPKELNTYLKGTGLESTYQSLVLNEMKDSDLQKDYYGVTFDASTTEGAKTVKAVHAYLQSSEYDFADKDGNKVKFTSGEFLPNFQTGTLPDGRTFVTVAEKDDFWGNQTRTVVVDKADDYFKDLLTRTAAKAKTIYQTSGSEYSKQVYNRILESSAYANVLNGDDYNIPLNTLGIMDNNLSKKKTGDIVTGVIKSPEGDIMVTGTKLDNGKVDIRLAIKNQEKNQWEEFNPQGERTLHEYNNFTKGLIEMTGQTLK